MVSNTRITRVRMRMIQARTSHPEEAGGGETRSLPLGAPQAQEITRASGDLGGAGSGAR